MLGVTFGALYGDEEGFADGSDEAVTVGLADGTEDFNTHSRLLALSFTDQQHFAISQLRIKPGLTKHSEMKSRQIGS